MPLKYMHLGDGEEINGGSSTLLTAFQLQLVNSFIGFKK